MSDLSSTIFSGLMKLHGEWLFIDALEEVDENLKKKKPKNKKKKKKAVVEPHSEMNKRVSWGSVEQIVFSRSISYSAVPSKGIPLGLGDEQEKFCYFIGESDAAASGGSTVEKASKYGALSDEDRAGLIGSFIGKDKSIDIANVAKELDIIRSSREATGCSCKPVKHIDKLSVAKLKSELVGRGKAKESLDSLNKTALVRDLRDVLNSCPMCTENLCECVLLEIKCSAEVCGCLEKGSKQICGNPFGRIIFDADQVRSFRESQLAALRSTSSSS